MMRALSILTNDPDAAAPFQTNAPPFASAFLSFSTIKTGSACQTMKLKRLILTIFAISFNARAGDWAPSRDLLQAICQIESCNGRYLYGDGGRSLGHFQLSRGAWKDVNAWRKARALKTYPYSDNVMNAFVNREYASNFLSLLYTQLEARLNREPTGPELYAAYNIGFIGFAQAHFDLNHINATTRLKCQQIAQMLSLPTSNPKPLASAPPSPSLPKKS